MQTESQAVLVFNTSIMLYKNEFQVRKTQRYQRLVIKKLTRQTEPESNDLMYRI